MTRTFQGLDLADLQDIRYLALSELDRFLIAAGTPAGKYRRYAYRLVGICLAPGAAQHYVDSQNLDEFDNEVYVGPTKISDKGFLVHSNGRVIGGVKDIDVWFFFLQDETLPIPNRRHVKKSLEVRLEALGKRRLDFMKKGISRHVLAETSSKYPREIIRTYLRETEHGRNCLSKRSLVGLHPDMLFSQPLWRTRRLSSA